jgi:hypothetical protein
VGKFDNRIAVPQLYRHRLPWWVWTARLSPFLLAEGCLLLIGCASQSVNAPAHHVSASPVSRISVSQSKSYQQAKALFDQKRYADADKILTQMLTDADSNTGSGLSTADRTFLQRQQQICRKATPNPSTKSVPKKTAVNPSKPSNVSSAHDVDCGPRALLLLCRESNPPVSASLPALCKAAEVSAPRGASLEGMTKAAKSIGFTAEAVQMDRDALANLSTPAIAWVDGNHYLAVYRVNRSLRGIDYDTATIQDPNKNTKEDIPLTKLLSRSGGVLMMLMPPKTTATAQR